MTRQTPVLDQPDLTDPTFDVDAHIAHLGVTRERLTAELPDLERRCALRDPVACYDYFATMDLLRRIDTEIEDAEAERQFREANRKHDPHWLDVGRVLLHGRHEINTHFRTMR